MLGRPQSLLIDGPAGHIEVVVEDPTGPTAPRGLAVIAHPHPLMGGTMDNKVVHTLVRAFVLAGWRAVRFNFRGVGQSEGQYDEGRGETTDLLSVVSHHLSDPTLAGKPLALAGFSFGGYVAAQASSRLLQAAADQPAVRAPSTVVLVSPAASRFDVPAVPPHTLVVQGEADDVVPLSAILDWARPQQLPVTVVPGAGHFFHGQLGGLRDIVLRHLRADAAREAGG
ncbi:alpha/beta hydrolase [Aquabacterium parvum]|uniref:alpha/beta hydrolase n=1 Tax=Aquabacterium parvum TaxID=70584 RepID=UPI000718BA71|nr:alpha/beta family hydrolase [Aquabacterium parvum]MBU0917288.1 alpha/beta hydrolase [Gammaproteobacteria bacterium]